MSEQNPDSPAGEEQPEEAPTAPEGGSESTENDLGDAGKKALDKMKSERNEARNELKALRGEFEALKAKSEGREKEWEAEQERRKVEAEALDKANQRILKAEVRAAAASKLNDPADALRFIDTSEFEVGSDGEVDASHVSKAVDDLLADKPYLAAQGDGARREPAPDHSQGAKGQAPRSASDSFADYMRDAFA